MKELIRPTVITMPLAIPMTSPARQPAIRPSAALPVSRATFAATTEPSA